MRRLLQVLTIVLLVLSVAAVVLGTMLFNRRELLKGRTQALEKGLVQLSAIIEAPVEIEQKVATFDERDVEDATAQLNPTPQRSTFWPSYPLYLEDVDKSFATIRAEDLMHFYKMDPITGKPMKDPATGYPITKGEETMDATIQTLLGAAQHQLDELNQTRHQLRRVREELVSTIQDLNTQKQRLRQALNEITTLNATISGLQGDVRRLESQVIGLESDKRDLEDQVAQHERTIEEQKTEISLRDETIAAQRKRINDLVSAAKDPTGIQGSAPPGIIKSIVEAGRKGQVVSVNADWTYVVLELSDEFIAEIDEVRAALSKNETPGIPVIELFLKRGETFVAKVQLVQIKRDQKLGIADVLVDWQQMPVQTGDVAFY